MGEIGKNLGKTPTPLKIVGQALEAYGQACTSGILQQQMQFWSNKLDRSKDYTVYPQETLRIDAAMPVTIRPTPEKLYRIWFYFAEAKGDYVKSPSTTEKIERKGFTVVEWGGMVQ